MGLWVRIQDGTGVMQDFVTILGITLIMALLVVPKCSKPAEEPWTIIEMHQAKGCLRVWVDEELRQSIGCGETVRMEE